MSSRSFRREPDGKLPVFAFPGALNFFYEDQSTHKQVLTVYNPYDFTVQFKVFCNNPTKYTVVESEGIIKKACCIDIVIRVTDFSPNGQREDKFRIHLYEHHSLKSDFLGTKEISAYLHPTGKNQDKQSKSTQRATKRSSTKEVDEVFYKQRRESVIVQRSLPSVPVIILSICCIIILMLPNNGEKVDNYFIPPYLHISMNQKLIAAYVLGLVTMAILKT